MVADTEKSILRLFRADKKTGSLIWETLYNKDISRQGIAGVDIWDKRLELTDAYLSAASDIRQANRLLSSRSLDSDTWRVWLEQFEDRDREVQRAFSAGDPLTLNIVARTIGEPISYLRNSLSGIRSSIDGELRVENQKVATTEYALNTAKRDLAQEESYTPPTAAQLLQLQPADDSLYAALAVVDAAAAAAAAALAARDRAKAMADAANAAVKAAEGTGTGYVEAADVFTNAVDVYIKAVDAFSEAVSDFDSALADFKIAEQVFDDVKQLLGIDPYWTKYGVVNARTTLATAQSNFDSAVASRDRKKMDSDAGDEAYRLLTNIEIGDVIFTNVTKPNKVIALVPVASNTLLVFREGGSSDGELTEYKINQYNSPPAPNPHSTLLLEATD